MIQRSLLLHSSMLDKAGFEVAVDAAKGGSLAEIEEAACFARHCEALCGIAGTGCEQRGRSSLSEEQVARLRSAALRSPQIDELSPLNTFECLLRDGEAHLRPLAPCVGLEPSFFQPDGCSADSAHMPQGTRSDQQALETTLGDTSTEQILESARNLDQLSVDDVLGLIHREDGEAHRAVGKVLPRIAEAVDVLACAVGGGGRWFNVGAGTSGRLGVLDASEIPPTFGMSTQVVQGVIAGGDRALRRAIEGAEDDKDAARFELAERGLTLGDVVVAVSASGHTPFAIAAVEAAVECGARSIAVTNVPESPLAEMAEISIVPDTGAEVVTGSTRMKAGLSQKMVLAMLSTAVMVRLGRVEGSLMTHISPVSNKLQSRSLRILMSLADITEEAARAILERHDGELSAALRAIRAGSHR